MSRRQQPEAPVVVNEEPQKITLSVTASLFYNRWQQECEVSMRQAMEIERLQALVNRQQKILETMETKDVDQAR